MAPACSATGLPPVTEGNLRSTRFDRYGAVRREDAGGTQGTQGTSESREPNGQDRGTARRALLGAARCSARAERSSACRARREPTSGAGAAATAGLQEPAQADRDRHRAPGRQRLSARAHLRLKYQLPALTWEPTSSRPVTWCPPRTATSSAGTSRRSAAPPTCRRTPSSPTARPPRPSTASPPRAGSPRTSPLAELKTLRAVGRLRQPPAQHALQRPLGDPHLRRGAPLAGRADRQTRAGRATWIYPKNQAPHLLPRAGPRPGGAPRHGAPQTRQGQEELAGHHPVLRADQHPAPRQAGRQPARRAALRREHPPLKELVTTGDPRTVADLVKPEGLKWIASYAQGIGPTLDLVIPKDANGALTTPTTLVADAHRAGLILHPYTMRNENTFLPANFRQGTDPNAYGDAFGASGPISPPASTASSRTTRTPRCSPARTSSTDDPLTPDGVTVPAPATLCRVASRRI